MARIRTGRPNGRPTSPLQGGHDMLMKNVPMEIMEKIDRLRKGNETRKDVILRLIQETPE